MTIKPNQRKFLAALFLAFLILFSIKFISSFFIKTVEVEDKSQRIYNVFGSYSDLKYEKRMMSNVAQIAIPDMNFLDNGPVDLLQVFEQEANVKSTTDAFENEENNVRKITNKLGAMIRYEKNGGLKPNRFLNFVIGIAPNKFDSLVTALQDIGELSDLNITKEDKTQAFRRLYSKRESLKVYKNSLLKLRTFKGKVEEFILLEEKIQVIEKQIQEFGVQLGDFVEKEPFSNVVFSLAEIRRNIIDKEEYPIVSRVVDSFVWTIKWYFLIILIAGIVFLTHYSIKIMKE